MAFEIKSFRTMRAGVEMDFRGFVPGPDGVQTDEAVDVTLVVPPLNFDALQPLDADLKEMGAKSPADLLATVRNVMKQALRRNYRNVPDWLINQSIDFDNLQEALSLVTDVSGLKRREIDQGKATAAMNGAGTESTAT